MSELEVLTEIQQPFCPSPAERLHYLSSHLPCLHLSLSRHLTAGAQKIPEWLWGASCVWSRRARAHSSAGCLPTPLPVVWKNRVPAPSFWCPRAVAHRHRQTEERHAQGACRWEEQFVDGWSKQDAQSKQDAHRQQETPGRKRTPMALLRVKGRLQPRPHTVPMQANPHAQGTLPGKFPSIKGKKNPNICFPKDYSLKLKRTLVFLTTAFTVQSSYLKKPDDVSLVRRYNIYINALLHNYFL